MQTQLQNSKMADRQRNTVKVAVLDGDSAFKDLVAISSYDSKPMYFLSYIIPEVKWSTVDTKVYSKIFNKRINLEFLRLNFVDKNNQDMNSVDQADQLHTNFNVGKGLRQGKWWWSIYFYGVLMLLLSMLIFSTRLGNIY